MNQPSFKDYITEEQFEKLRGGKMTNYDILKEYEAHKTPVPSYEEWQELKEASDGLSKLMFKSLMNRFVKADEEREKLAEENQQLKELLKECREIFIRTAYTHKFDMVTKIDNAIGENK